MVSDHSILLHLLRTADELSHRFVVRQPTLSRLGDDMDILKTPPDRDGTTWLTDDPSSAATRRLAPPTLLGRPSTLQRYRRSIAAGIGGPHQDAALGVAHDQLDFAIVDARAAPGHTMPHGFQSLHHSLRHLRLYP